MLRTMDGEIFGMSPTKFWPIIGVVVLVLVVLIVLLVCYCCYCYCKNTRKNKGYHQYRYRRVSPQDDLESTTQLTPHRSVADLASYPDDVEEGESGMWPGHVDSIGHDPPVVNSNQKRTILPLPDNFSRFITDFIVPFFEKQRLTANQFAVVVLLSEDDIDNICGTRFVPSNGGEPTLNNSHPSMPHSASHYGNYIVARPNSSWHSEEEIFVKYSSINSPFSQLWNAYMRRNGSTPKCVLLYSWNLPCSRCTNVIIRSLNDSMYRCTSVILAYSTYWQKELGAQYIENKEKLKKENIAVEEVQYPIFIRPA